MIGGLVGWVLIPRYGALGGAWVVNGMFIFSVSSTALLTFPPLSACLFTAPVQLVGRFGRCHHSDKAICCGIVRHLSDHQRLKTNATVINQQLLIEPCRRLRIC
ncbi:MAG UNVERIFIED_CONTAM: hypothetical protein LVT10_23345 [Anaerolineae bacterium]